MIVRKISRLSLRFGRETSDGLWVNGAMRMIPCGILFIISSISMSSSSMAQTYLSRIQIASARRIESKPVDPYMSDLEERILLQRLREALSVSPAVNTLRALPIAFAENLPLVIDEQALEEIGLTADQEFDFEEGAEGRPIGANLRWILRQLDLTFVISHAKVVITTQDAAEAMPAIRIYDVTPLLSVWQQNGQSVIDPTSLLETIQTSVQADTWESMGGPSSISPIVVRSRCLLVVSAPTTVHLDVDQLLNQLDRTSASFVNSRPQKSVPIAPLPKCYLPSGSGELPIFGGMF